MEKYEGNQIIGKLHSNDSTIKLVNGEFLI